MVKVLKIVYENKRTLAYVVSFSLVCFACLSLLKSCVFYDAEGAVEEQSRNEYSSISTEYLGKYLYEKYPNSIALVFYDSLSSSEVVAERLVGLRKSLDGNIEILKEVGLPTTYPKDIPSQMLRANEYIKASDFDKAIKKYPQANLIITLVGVPDDVKDMKLWKITDSWKRPKVAVFGGSIRKLKPAIEAGLIQAVVSFRRMDHSVNQLPPEDLEEAFNKRFMLFTADSFKKKK